MVINKWTGFGFSVATLQNETFLLQQRILYLVLNEKPEGEDMQKNNVNLGVISVCDLKKRK